MIYTGTFEDHTGRVITIRPVDDPHMPFRVRVTLPKQIDQALRAHPDYPFEIIQELKGWLAHDDNAGEHLKVEAGMLKAEGIGPTLNLFPMASDTLEPLVFMGLYDDWEDDLGLPWAYPLSPYHRQGKLLIG